VLCRKLHGEIFLLARIDRAVSGMVYDAGSQVPVCASIWSCPSEVVLGFSAASILTFCRNHHLLQVLFFVLCHVSGSRTLLGKFYLFFLHCWGSLSSFFWRHFDVILQNMAIKDIWGLQCCINCHLADAVVWPPTVAYGQGPLWNICIKGWNWALSCSHSMYFMLPMHVSWRMGH
jgi:hypothetical protein